MQERPLRTVCDDNKSNFKEPLDQDGSFTIHKRNIHYLAIVKNGLSTIIMNDVFQFSKNSARELRSGNHLQRTNNQTAHFGNESIDPIPPRVFRVSSGLGGAQSAQHP